MSKHFVYFRFRVTCRSFLKCIAFLAITFIFFQDIEYKLDRYCQPRNSLLLLISNFVMKCSAKLAEINKKDRQEKAVELLDNKCYMKMVEIAHSLLKMAPYDQECIKSKGLQMYMTQVFP